jgi:branched-chain amino acid transport system substrate-binding protein
MQSSNGQTSVERRGRAGAAVLSRREFLRKVVASGASVVGVATGLGGLLSGCDGEEETSNTTATVHPGETTTTVVTARTSTTVVVDLEKGRDIKVGLVSAATGSLALYGKADEWWTARASDVLPDGIVCGDGKLHRLVLIRRDSRSEPERAAQAAAELILDARVDVVLCSGGTDLVVPVAAQAETLICPCLCSFVQWRPFLSALEGTAQRPLAWAYAHAVGLEDIAANFTAMWDRLRTNRRVGLLFPDSPTGRAWADPTAGLPPAATAAGYECVLPDAYPVPGGDFGQYVSEFKKNGCEILCGVLTARELADLWRQVLEREYQPKIVTIGEGLLFPHALEAVGPTALNLTAECLWQPDWPYRDSITGKTCRDLADDYMAKTGDQWTPAIAQYATFEWMVDALKRVTDLNGRREIIEKIMTTELETCLGPIDFTEPVGSPVLGTRRRPAKNVYKAPVGGAQWVEGDAFGFEPLLVTAVNSPGLVTAGSLRPMQYGA